MDTRSMSLNPFMNQVSFYSTPKAPVIESPALEVLIPL